MFPSHWIYLAGLAAVIVTVVAKKNVVPIALHEVFNALDPAHATTTNRLSHP